MPEIAGVQCLDLSLLINRQAVKLGLPVHTGMYSLPRGGAYAYTTHPDPEKRGVRNLVVAYRA